MALFDDHNYEANCLKIKGKRSQYCGFTFWERGCIEMDSDGFKMEPQRVFLVPAKDTTGVEMYIMGFLYMGCFTDGVLEIRHGLRMP